MVLKKKNNVSFSELKHFHINKILPKKFNNSMNFFFFGLNIEFCYLLA